jgi:hypothetical protein
MPEPQRPDDGIRHAGRGKGFPVAPLTLHRGTL